MMDESLEIGERQAGLASRTRVQLDHLLDLPSTRKGGTVNDESRIARPVQDGAAPDRRRRAIP